MSNNIQKYLKKYLIGICILLFGTSFFIFDFISTYFLGYVDHSLTKEISIDENDEFQIKSSGEIFGSIVLIRNGSFKKEEISIHHNNLALLKNILVSSNKSSGSSLNKIGKGQIFNDGIFLESLQVNKRSESALAFLSNTEQDIELTKEVMLHKGSYNLGSAFLISQAEIVLYGFGLLIVGMLVGKYIMPPIKSFWDLCITTKSE